MRQLTVHDLNPSASRLLPEVLGEARIAGGGIYTRSSVDDPLVAAWYVMDRSSLRQDTPCN